MHLLLFSHGKFFLGFGHHNAFLFQKEHEVFERLAVDIYYQNKQALSNLRYFEIWDMVQLRKQAILLSSTPWDVLVSEYREIKKQLSFTLNDLVRGSSLHAISLPVFKVDSMHPETFELLHRYLEAQKRSLNFISIPIF